MNKEILRLAIPSILANITVPFVGMVDMAIAGHLADASAIGGIAFGTMLFDLLYWNFGFLRVGTGGMTAQAFGRRHYKAAMGILVQSLGTAMAAALLVWAIQYVFYVVVLSLTTCSASVEAFAHRYFFIRIWAAPATLMLMAFRGWFIGMQNTVWPMIIDIVVNGVNILASYLLATQTTLGVMGVAYGTLVAQYVGLATAIVLLVVRYHALFHYLDWNDPLKLKNLRIMFVLNSNLFIRSLCFMVVYVGFTALAARYGDEPLAASAIIMKLFMLFSFFVDGFAYAGEALVGRFVGERCIDDVKRVTRVLCSWAIAIGVACTLLYAIVGQELIRLLTTDAPVIAAAASCRWWLVAMPVVSALSFMWDGIYVGATAGVQVRNAMIWAAVCFVLCYLALAQVWGIQALYAAYFAHLAARAIYLHARFKPLCNSLTRKIESSPCLFS